MKIEITSTYKRNVIIKRLQAIFGTDNTTSFGNMNGFESIGTGNNLALSIDRNSKFNFVLWYRYNNVDANTINNLI